MRLELYKKGLKRHGDDSMPRKPTNYLEGRKCCKCGKSETFIGSNGRHHWYHDRDK